MEYTKLLIEEVKFNNEDIISTSGNDNNTEPPAPVKPVDPWLVEEDDNMSDV